MNKLGQSFSEVFLSSDSFIGASSVPEIWELGIKELLALVSIRSFKSKLF